MSFKPHSTYFTAQSNAPSASTLKIFWWLFAALWLYSLSLRALITPDEGRYATIAMNMLQSGDWITPRLNGLLYFEKPIFQYWMSAVAFAIFGFNEFAARLWPGLAGLFSIAAVWFTACRLWGKPIAQLAALATAAMTWVIINSHFLTLDMGVSFFLTLTLCGFLLAQEDTCPPKQRRFWMWLAWAAMAGATLSKGLIGLLIPAASLVLYSLIHWRWQLWQRMQWLSGLAIFLALTAPWFVLVSQRNAGFAHFFFIHEHFERFLTTEHHREGPLWYFVPYLLIGLFPWTTLLWQAFKRGWQQNTQAFQSQRFIIIWCVFVFVFFSKSGSKLPSYILPMFPALGLLLGNVLQQLNPQQLKKHLLLPALVWFALLALYPFAGRFASDSSPITLLQPFAQYLALAGLTSLITLVISFKLLNNNKKITAIMLVAMSSLASLSLVAVGHSHYAQSKTSRQIPALLAGYRQPDTQYYSVSTYDQTFPYYLRHNVTLVDYVDEFAFGEKAEPQRWLPTLEKFSQQWQADSSAVAMLSHESYAGLKQQALPMQTIYQDERRIVVVKPNNHTARTPLPESPQ